MPKKHLTAQFLRNLKPQDKRIGYYDQHLIRDGKLKGKGVKGLFIRLTKAGSIYFYYRYWFNETAKSFKIGSYPDIGLSQARERARELSGQVNSGIDPQSEKNKRKHQSDKLNFKQVSDEFIANYLPTLRDRTAKEYKRHIEVYLKPLNKTPINDITANQILHILDQKAYREESPTMANRIRSTLSSLFSFAKKRGTATENIIESIPTYNVGSSKRSRYYSEKELRILWAWFDSFDRPIGEVFKMLLITGQRKTETMRMRWIDLDLDQKVWTIPAELAKNKQPHDVPLSGMAIDIIESLTNDSEYVFESPVLDGEPVQSIKAAKERVQDDKKKGISDFRPHDLRRTFASHCAKLGVDRTTLGKILNHKGLAGDSQVTAIYDRHSYLVEKETALNRWSHRLQQIISGTETNITKIS